MACHQAIIRTNAGISLIGALGTNFREILIDIDTFSFKKIHLKMSSFRLGFNALNWYVAADIAPPTQIIQPNSTCNVDMHHQFFIKILQSVIYHGDLVLTNVQ